METMIKENNLKITTTINDNLNDKLKDFQTTLIKTCEEMIAHQMSVINLNMINIIKVTLEEQRVTPQIPTNSIQQQDTMQHSNITQYISPSTPLNTQPISQLTESPLTSTGPTTNERQKTAQCKQQDPPDSEEEVNTSEETNDQDIIMEDQNISTPNQTRTATRLSAPALRDSKNKSQLTSKKTVSRQGKGRK